ncbi:MAG TPA: hypothetical protein ENN51_05905 [candidate division WOR-3 bacterium]|uniref:histidine kinase n=1 Tax=candidate division WOR-3 bacterium TaxID=2052148 RepID=A0A7V0XFG6_UNCW3|nr:hypothetical protein [candidate division WOR-3 bacterium]
MRASAGSHGRRFAFWAAALAVAAIVVFNLQGWWAFTRMSRALEAELGARLEAIATTASTALAGSWQEPEAERILRAVREDNELLGLFIVDDDLRRWPAGDETLPAAPEADLPGLLSALSGIPARSPVYRSGRLYLKSAYAPLRDSTGAVSAALGVEADARFFATLAEMRGGLLLINLLSLLAIVAVVLVSVSLVRHALRVEQAAARANSLALLGQMSAAVAHEVKNPLAIIRSTAERIRKQYGRDSDDPKFRFIQDEVDRLAGVVSNYLGISRPRSESVGPVDLGELAREVADRVAAEAERSGVRISADSDERLPTVTGNRDELRQALLNLALNAVQAQADGGRVEIAARRDGHDVVLRVRDEGPGVDERTARRMFEPFFTTREKGSGLGLFLVRRTVEAHGGRVELANPGAAGAELVVRLPAARM